MDRLTSMSVFARVADLGSFTAAAKELRISPTMIGKHIRFLEDRLGSQLINRSTRRQGLTELGRNYLDHCKHLLVEAEAGDALVEEALSAPRGRLRVATSVAFGSYSLAPALVRFMNKYPEVSVDLILSDKMVDLLEEGLDAAIRRHADRLHDDVALAVALHRRGLRCAELSRRTRHADPPKGPRRS